MDEETLRKLIMERVGISRAELDSLVEKRIKEFAGLLTELGALYTIAKDFGIEVDVDEYLGTKKAIGELKAGDEGVTVRGRVIRVMGPRETKKNGRKLRYAWVFIDDGTGRIRVVLWGRDVELVGKKIRPGVEIEVVNGRVESYGDRLSLNPGYTGRVLVIEGEEPEGKPIGELKEGDIVRLELQVLRYIQRGRPTVLLASDGQDTIRVVVWQEDTVPGEGSRIRVVGDVRRGRTGLELHAQEIEVIEEGKKFTTLDMVEEGAYVRTVATLTALRSRKPFAGTCNVCGGPVEWKDGRPLCAKCGSEDVSIRPVLVFTVEDGFGSIKGVFFDDLALSFCGSKYPDPACLEEAKKALGRDLVLEGVVKRSQRGTLDLVVKRAREVDVQEYLKVLMGEVERELKVEGARY